MAENGLVIEPLEFTLLAVKLFLRRALVWLAGIAVVIAVLFGLFCAEEDYRGSRAWADCQRELAAKGESLDLRQLAPPGKPEDDLSKVPIFAELYKRDDEIQKTKKSSIKPRIDRLEIDFPWREGNRNGNPRNGNYLRGESYDIAAWQKYYRTFPETKLSATVVTPAQDILQALKVFDPELAEIDTAMSNPNAYWPFDYDKPFGYVGGMTKTMSIARVLQFRAVAELENGQPDLAEKDLLDCLRLNRSLTKNFFFINYLVMRANHSMAYGILWEGIRRHAWSDNQLLEIESAFAAEDSLTDAVRALRTERASSLTTLGYIQRHDAKAIIGWGNDDPAMTILYFTWHLRPKGWWDQDRSEYARDFQTLVEAIHPDRGSIDPDAFAAEDAELQQPLWRQIGTPFTAMAIPIDRRQGPKIAKAETYRRLARIACRLEEYRIAHRQYPATLDQLPNLPPHLTNEVIGTNTFRYELKGEGYTIYSVGWDQIDDHGALTKKGREVDQGGMINDSWDADWPWPSP